MTALVLEARRPRYPLADDGFEVSYVPDGGAEHRVPLAQASAVPLEQGIPVRRFTSRKGQRHRSGLWSATTGSHVGFESWLERDHVLHLDFDPSVVGNAHEIFQNDRKAGGRPMFRRGATVLVVCLLLSGVAAPVAVADPDPDPVVGNDAAPAPPADNGVVPSGAPMTTTTPDGWVLKVVARDESQLAVAPLTTALSSRDYVVGGTFTGAVSGDGKTTLTGGTLDAGYQIGCGIDMGTSGGVELTGQIGAVPQLDLTGATFASPIPTGFQPRFQLPISGAISVYLKPGIVTVVPVDTTPYTGTEARITVTGFHIKIDGCVGQSFIRSYATLTSTTDHTHDVIVYMGVTKVV